MNMSIEQMIQFIKENPNVKVTHELFDPDEYIYADESGKIYDESEYLFEDWKSEFSLGIRLRLRMPSFKQGWKLYSLTPIDREAEKYVV